MEKKFIGIDNINKPAFDAIKKVVPHIVNDLIKQDKDVLSNATYEYDAVSDKTRIEFPKGVLPLAILYSNYRTMFYLDYAEGIQILEDDGSISGDTGSGSIVDKKVVLILEGECVPNTYDECVYIQGEFLNQTPLMNGYDILHALSYVSARKGDNPFTKSWRVDDWEDDYYYSSEMKSGDIIFADADEIVAIIVRITFNSSEELDGLLMLGMEDEQPIMIFYSSGDGFAKTNLAIGTKLYRHSLSYQGNSLSFISANGTQRVFDDIVGIIECGGSTYGGHYGLSITGISTSRHLIAIKQSDGSIVDFDITSFVNSAADRVTLL